MQKDKVNGNWIKNENSYNTFKDIVQNDVLKLFYQFTHLKNIYRQGWLTNLLGMEYENRVESVADHTWSVTLLAMTIIQKYKLDLDINKCMELALVHELGEIYAGDYTPNQISKEEKHIFEERAVDKLFENIDFDNNFKTLWSEYENVESKEAEFVKQVDKLECIIQASSYGLDTNYMLGAKAITLPCLLEVLNEVNELSRGKMIPKCNREENK